MNCLDLFAGAGGLTEGFIQEGYNMIAHVEKEHPASLTLKTRLAYYYLKSESRLDIYHKYLKKEITREEFYSEIPEEIINSVINEEINDITIDSIFQKIDSMLNERNIDIIIGGPPCQAYSLIGRPGNKKKENDVRLFLYKQYFRFIEKYNPKVIVFENVPGIYSAKGGLIFEDIKNEFQRHGYNFDYNLLNSKDFGVLQERKRVIIIGWKADIEFSYPKFEIKEHNYTIKDLFEDIPKVTPGTTMEFGNYSKNEIPKYQKTFGIRTEEDILLQHITRKHNEIDLRIYKKAIKMWDTERRRLKYTDIPAKDRTHRNITSFLDRFKVVNQYGLSHTMVAHISKDGHSYIHPDIQQLRSLSVREAARIQSFPDNFYFENSRTAAFTQIGNAVPPLMAKEIAFKIKNRLV